MLTIAQNILRTIFYLMCLYAGFLAIKIITHKHKNKKMDNCAIYVIISIMIQIILGNIIIFNIEMYDAILGTMEEHTIIFTAILTMAGIGLYFLTKLMKDEKI